jgi:hypothetical protein
MRRINVKNYRVVTLPLLLGLSVVGLSLILARPPGVKAATTRTVNTLSDTHSNGNGNDGQPALTLREAIQFSASDDTINFSVVGTITLTSGELAIARSLTIIGPTNGSVVVSGNNASRVFNITGGTVSISNIAITIGRAAGTPGTNCEFSCSAAGPGGPGQGGGILNNANSTLFLTNCTLAGNSANGGAGGVNINVGPGGSGGGGSGGGIYNLGALKLENCTLSGNSASGGNGGDRGSGGTGANGGPASGGSLYNEYPGILTMENCTLNDNHANGGNGHAGVNSSKGGSGGNVLGGSIYNESTLTLIACTLTGNSANGGTGGEGGSSGGGAGGFALGGGVFDGGSGNYRNSIIAGDTVNGGAGGMSNLGPNGATGSTIGPDVDGPISSQGFNLIGRRDGSLGWVSSDLLGGTTDATKLNPNLGPLQPNGGPTRTMALLPGSAAINAGDDSITGPPLNLSTDQRGLARKSGSRVDIGAFEVQPVNSAPTITAAPALSRQQGSAATASTIATVNDAETPAGNLNVTVASAPIGISVTNLVNTGGTITANVAASCSATAGANTIGLQVTDGGGATATANLTVNVTANTAPTLSYNNPTAIAAGSSFTVNPVSGPADNGTVSAVVVQSISPNSFTGTLTVNSAGAVATGNAGPAGTYTITIRATDNCGATRDATFTFTVNANCPAITVNPATLPAGTSGAAYNQSFTASGGAGSVNFSQSGTLPTGMSFAGGVLSGTPTQSGNFPITVTATDANGCAGGQNYTLVVSAGPTPTPTPPPPADSVQFSADGYSVDEGAGGIAINVTRTGSTSAAATVDYATADASASAPCASATGLASQRCDYTFASGTLSFAPGEANKTFTVLVADDAYIEGGERLNLVLSNPTGVGLGIPNTAALNIQDNDPGATNGNPVDDPAFFVRQHYADFLNRAPDASGLNFWTGEIAGCGGDQQCREAKRVNVSAAFFLSIEFQNTGYLVYRTYKTSFGDLAGKPVPLTFRQLMTDTQRIGRGVIVNQGDWQAQLEANKAAFFNGWVRQPAFLARYPAGMGAADFVDALNANTGGSLTAPERDALVNQLAADNTTQGRASALRQVAENAEFTRRESNRGFVLMQYFGYLRRNPDDAPDSDFGGYGFWLSKLEQFRGNYINAEMVKAFISSTEYRGRFGSN